MGLLVRETQYVTKKQKEKSKHQLDKAWLILEIYLIFNPKMIAVFVFLSYDEIQAGYKSPLAGELIIENWNQTGLCIVAAGRGPAMAGGVIFPSSIPPQTEEQQDLTGFPTKNRLN